MKKHTKTTMPRLRRPHAASAPTDYLWRALGARQAGVMTPTELRAEVMALIG
ncbi:MAG: hypothetical protein KGP14_13175 [Betaproteobacteria bacterium]|nr:hypothetical protein [Betaproteobacteria bacterium]